MISTRNRASVATLAILFAFAYLAFFAVVAVTVMATAYLSGLVAAGVGILVFLIASGFAIQIFERLRGWRSVRDLQRHFPGYPGRRIPIFSLLSLAGSEPGRHDRNGYLYSLGIAGDHFFLLRNSETRHSDAPHKRVGGRVVEIDRQPVRLPFRDIAGISVIERTDEEMAAGAVDPRDYADRLGSSLAQWATGTKIKTRIVPYAAYLIVELADGRALVTAVPSEVSKETVTALGAQLREEAEEGNWLVDAAVGKIQSAIGEEAHGRAIDWVGETPVEAFDTVRDWTGDVQWVLNPDSAAIGSTKGGLGRRAAQLVAAEIKLAALSARN